MGRRHPFVFRQRKHKRNGKKDQSVEETIHSVKCSSIKKGEEGKEEEKTGKRTTEKERKKDNKNTYTYTHSKKNRSHRTEV